MSCRECDLPDYPIEYEYGYAVGRNAILMSNPYKPFTDKYNNWLSGFNAGKERRGVEGKNE